MILELQKDIDGYDLCIIGAGAAGITLAAELAYSGMRICVLEGGGEKPSAADGDMKRVLFSDLPIKYDSRERGLGGSTATWNGLSAPIDPIDMREWPLSHDELQTYLQQTQRYKFPPLTVFNTHDRHGTISKKIFIAVRPPYRYSSLRYLFEREGLDLFLQVTVTQLISELHDAGRRVTEAVGKTAEGNPVRVRAKAFVLAAGAIENVRLLLNSPAGETALGNGRDQVGRYFMNHPKGFAGVIKLYKPLPLESEYLKQGGVYQRYAGLRLNEAFQKEKGLLNSYVQFEPRYSKPMRYLMGASKRIARLLHLPAFVARPRILRLRWFADMQPQSGNRITLGEERDRKGMPLPIVNYSLSRRDTQTLKELYAQLMPWAKERLGVVTGDPDELGARVRDDASHHLGGTRMGTDPSVSVVNADCRLHDAENVYVAGGSVFPTAGCANPTMTIVALAIRLAEYLQTLALPRGSSGPLGQVLPSPGDYKPDPIIIIGAGKRAGTDIVPALESLPHLYRIAGIFAKHAGVVFGRQQRYDVKPLDTLSDAALASARFVYIAVPTPAVEAVVRNIVPRLSTGTALIIDTPILLSRATQRLLAGRTVHVAEDSVFLPWIPIAKRAGPIRTIECIQSVYRYHGIALLKTLTGGVVRYGWRWGNSLWLRAGAARVRILEPRDYAKGRFLINGHEISLSAVPLSPEESRLLGGPVREADTIVSHMTELKRVGLRRLLECAAGGGQTWSLKDGLDDARADRLVHRYRAYFNFYSEIRNDLE